MREGNGQLRMDSLSRRFDTCSYGSELVFVASLILVRAYSGMAAVNTFDVSREGKDLKIRLQAGDMTVARLSRAFQASATHLTSLSSCKMNISF